MTVENAQSKIPRATTPEAVEAIRRLRARSRIYVLLVMYIAIVCLNALSVVILIWLQAFGKVNLPSNVLIGLAAGTGGLGAGSLVFSSPIKALFSN